MAGMNTPSSFTLSLVYLPLSDTKVLSFFWRPKSPEAATLVTAEMPSGILKVSRLCDSQATLGTQRLMCAWVNRPPRYHAAPPQGASSRGARTVPIPFLVWRVPCSLPSPAPSSETESTPNKPGLPGKRGRVLQGLPGWPPYAWETQWPRLLFPRRKSFHSVCVSLSVSPSPSVPPSSPFHILTHFYYKKVTLVLSFT